MKKITRLVLVLLLTLGIQACGDSDDDGYIRVLHASPDAPNVDVLVDGEVVLSDVPYKAISPYLNVEEGDRRIQVNVAGTDTTVIDAVLNIGEDVSNTVIASNFVAAIAPIVTVDDRSTPESGTARIRVAHLAPSAPEVDVYVTPPGVELTDADPTLTTVPFSAVSGYVTLPAGSYQIRVTVAGTLIVAIDTGAIEVMDGAVFTAAALDATGGGTPFELELYSDL